MFKLSEKIRFVWKNLFGWRDTANVFKLYGVS